MSIFSKIIGDPNERFLKKLQPIVDKINKLEKKFERFSNEELKKMTDEFKERLKKGESLDNILPEAFAVVREAAKKTLNQRHYDVQLIGGIILHQGKIAEMKTGEGKTLAATLPLYLNALTGKGVHLVTVNDYLARRDVVWMGQIYDLLGLTTGCIVHDNAYVYDKEYNKDKISGSAQLHNKSLTKSDQSSNLNDKNSEKNLDEKRDELGGFKIFEEYLKPISRKEAYQSDIVYGTNNEFGFDYLRDNMAHSLEQVAQKDLYYVIIDEVDSILIDEARTPLIISAPDSESPKTYEQFAKIIPQLEKDIDYNIDEKMKAVTLTNEGMDKVEKIMGIEDLYGATGVHYVHYLEQSLKASTLFEKDKDYVVKNGEIIIVDEFTGRLMPGRRWSDGLHQAVEAKERVRVKEESKTLASITFQNYFRMYEKLAGMTGTALTSAEEFDSVYKLNVISVPTSKIMIRQFLPDRIYKNEQGKFKAITREIKERHEKGQPILIGTISIEKNEFLGLMLKKEGVPCEILNAKHHEREGTIIAQAGRLGAVTVATNMAGRGVDIVLGGNPPNKEEAEKIKKLGGLYVVGTERHEARRIDNQLRGRSGRQGDPGSSQFFVSLEDELMRRFGSDKIGKIMETLGIPEDQPIENKFISNGIEKAQARIEGVNFDIRKHVLEYDDVMNKHREKIYRIRRKILSASDQEIEQLAKEKLEKILNEEEQKQYQEKEKKLGENQIRKLEKFVMLNIIDTFWIAHLDRMSSLREGIGLRAYGQRDPLVEYKNEGHRLFGKFLEDVDVAIAETLLKAELREAPIFERKIDKSIYKGKVGRNDPCPCGSGKKYKKCCYPKYGR